MSLKRQSHRVSEVIMAKAHPRASDSLRKLMEMDINDPSMIVSHYIPPYTNWITEPHQKINTQ